MLAFREYLLTFLSVQATDLFILFILCILVIFMFRLLLIGKL